MTGRPGAAPLELRQAARRFGRRWALRGVTLTVAPGEVVAVIGANGSGKSTLLRVAASALSLTSGDGAVFGHSLRHAPASVRPLVGLLGHSPGLYDDLTVAENLEFSARMLDRPDPRKAAADAGAFAGLTKHLADRVGTLSSGWQRRVALARLWMQQPRLLLLDEPYNSFDEEGVRLVNDLIRRTGERGGATLVVTHTLEHARAVVDRRVLLRAGVVDEGASRPGGPTDSAASIGMSQRSGESQIADATGAREIA